MLRAQLVQDVFCYNNLIKRVASSFEQDSSINLPWEKIKKDFRISWSQFYYDVIMEINSRVFSIKQGVLFMITFRYEDGLFGDRCLIPLRQNIPL